MRGTGARNTNANTVRATGTNTDCAVCKQTVWGNLRQLSFLPAWRNLQWTALPGGDL